MPYIGCNVRYMTQSNYVYESSIYVSIYRYQLLLFHIVIHHSEIQYGPLLYAVRKIELSFFIFHSQGVQNENISDLHKNQKTVMKKKKMIVKR